MKRNIIFLILTLISGFLFSQKDSTNFLIGKNYDARNFLTKTQTVTFNKIFVDFDNRINDSKNEWNDVDPLKIFTNIENIQNRRKLFLHEFDFEKIGSSMPSEQQLAFKSITEKNIKNSLVILDANDIKISFPYTETYQKDNIQRNLLEKLSDLGLQWSQVGGDNLYIYNGNILLGKYKSGYVSIANLKIDNVVK